VAAAVAFLAIMLATFRGDVNLAPGRYLLPGISAYMTCLVIGGANAIELILRKLGLTQREIGANLSAARYAGIRVNWTIVLTMAIAGGLAGLAGTVETLGLYHRYAPEFTGSSGFEGITVALLGGTQPFGVVLSSVFMGALYGGAAKMQFDSGVRSEIIQVVQALVLILVAAPEIVRVIYRIRGRRTGEDTSDTQLATGWGG